MLEARYFRHELRFITPAGTSRGVLTTKPSWFIHLRNRLNAHGMGECGLLPGLSCDDKPGYEATLAAVCDALSKGTPMPSLREWPSIRFGVEMALRDLDTPGRGILFHTPFSLGAESIAINGLVWMGPSADMAAQIAQKLNSGFNCIKLKIGSLNWNEELALVASIRKRFTWSQITIRVDANGAFTPGEAAQKLADLAPYDIHSIEQPIKPRQWEAMYDLCRREIVPIALDEELIGLHDLPACEEMLGYIRPQYVVIKPSLVGGFAMSDLWIELATRYGAGWWITSALESNVGLNAIAQYTSGRHPHLPQGLGTGALYHNNFASPLVVEQGALHYRAQNAWNWQPNP